MNWILHREGPRTHNDTPQWFVQDAGGRMLAGPFANLGGLFEAFGDLIITQLGGIEKEVIEA